MPLSKGIIQQRLRDLKDLPSGQNVALVEVYTTMLHLFYVAERTLMAEDFDGVEAAKAEARDLLKDRPCADCGHPLAQHHHDGDCLVEQPPKSVEFCACKKFQMRPKTDADRMQVAPPKCPICGETLDATWDGDGYFLEHGHATVCPWTDDGEEMWRN